MMDLAQAFLQEIAQRETLHGHSRLNYELSNRDGQASREGLLVAVQHYAFAMVRLEQCPEWAVAKEVVQQQVYDHVVRCRLEDIRYLRDEALPIIAQTHVLDISALHNILNAALSFGRM